MIVKDTALTLQPVGDNEVHNITSLNSGKEAETFLIDLIKGSLPSLPDLVIERALVRWPKDKMKYVACVDIDYKMPNKCIDMAALHTIYPKPFAWQETKNQGAHLLYLMTVDYDADVQAACAIQALAKYLDCSGIELLSNFRVYDLKLFKSNTPEMTPANLKWNLRTMKYYTTNEVKNSKYNLKPGRHTHNECPFHPTTNKVDLNPSVVVTDEYVYCHRCNQSASITALAGGHTCDLLFERAWNQDVFEWVKSEFQRQAKEGHHPYMEDVAKKVYRAILESVHPGDHRNSFCFQHDFDMFCNSQGDWCDYRGRYLSKDRIIARMRLLPPANSSEMKKDKITNAEIPYSLGGKVNTNVIEKFYSPTRKTTLPKFDFRLGFDIGETNFLPSSRVDKQMHTYTKYYSEHELEAPSKGTQVISDMAKGFDTLESLAGINLPRRHILTGIFAHYYAEYEGQPQPVLVFTGPSETGKSFIGKMITSIVGGKFASLKEKGMEEGIGANLAKGCTCIILDECLKTKDPELFLSLIDNNVDARILYVGKVQLVGIATFIVTGVALEKCFTANHQFMRRVTVLPSLPAITRRGNPSFMLESSLRYDKEGKKAADAILHGVSAFLPTSKGQFNDFNLFLKHLEQIPELKEYFPEEEEPIYESNEEDFLHIMRALYTEGEISTNRSTEYNKTYVVKKHVSDPVYVAITDVISTDKTMSYDTPLSEFINERFWGAEVLKVKNLHIAMKYSKQSFKFVFAIHKKRITLDKVPGLKELLNV